MCEISCNCMPPLQALNISRKFRTLFRVGFGGGGDGESVTQSTLLALQVNKLSLTHTHTTPTMGS